MPSENPLGNLQGLPKSHSSPIAVDLLLPRGALSSRIAMSSRLQIVWEPSQQMVHARTSSHRRREQAGASPGHQMSSWHCLQTSMQITAMTLQARIQVHFWHTCNMGMHLLPHGAAMAWLRGLYQISAVSCSSQCASSLDFSESTPLQTGRATACMDTF